MEIDTETAAPSSGIGSGACATRALAQLRETPPPVINEGAGDPVLSDAPVRFVVEVPASIDLPPEEWTPGYADFASACSGVMYPMAEWIR